MRIIVHPEQLYSYNWDETDDSAPTEKGTVTDPRRQITDAHDDEVSLLRTKSR
jgi:hypothetical protein